MTSPASFRLAVDIGGTFTDTVLMDGAGAIAASSKVLTTHEAPVTGALEGASRVLADAEIAPGSVGGVIHGTTLATNALIERRGAEVACIATEGFRDILEIAYERRYSQYDIDLEKPDLIVRRDRCFTVPERVLADGTVRAPLDEAALPELVAALDACGAEAVAICLLHAYANPVHERRLAALIGAERPGLAISLSSEVSPEAREFDRLCTTLANAYVQPLMDRYLADLAAGFRASGLACPILMMTAGAGMTTLETARRLPIRLVESGPAGGAILAARLARQCGAEAVLSLDIGGTTAKLCLIDQGRPQSARRFEIARAARFVKGSGMPVRIPVVEMIEIGAGGGSIAGVDAMGRLTVGPESAGSEPGPAAFGRGGTRATVTDADIALGLIDPEAFAEGRIAIDRAAAEAALVRDVAAPLGLDMPGAARGVSAIVDESMGAAARVHAAESGKDLRARVMVAFGGNGPLHATRVARRAGVSRILVPPDPGVGSAVGFLHAPVAFEIVRSLYQRLGQLDMHAVNGLFAAMLAEAEAVARLAAPEAALSRTRTALMRYRGQGHEIEIALPDRALEAADLPALEAAFEGEYRRQFSRTVPGMVVEILNWAVRVSTPEPEAPRVPAPAAHTAAAPEATREIHCDTAGGPVAAMVYARAALAALGAPGPGARVVGPALIVEPQTTTLVSTGWEAATDSAGTLHLTRIPEEDAR